MIRSIRLAAGGIAALLVTAVSLFLATPAQAAVWSSSDKWATWSNGGYTLYNDVWGSGAGTQVIWANSYSNWGVWANHPATAASSRTRTRRDTSARRSARWAPPPAAST